jgi:hypothetical protein
MLNLIIMLQLTFMMEVFYMTLKIIYTKICDIDFFSKNPVINTIGEELGFE